MNAALDNALKAKGFETDKDRRRFADSIGMSDRTLRRWINEGATPGSLALGRIVARRLNTKYEDLWPTKELA